MIYDVTVRKIRTKLWQRCIFYGCLGTASDSHLLGGHGCILPAPENAELHDAIKYEI